MSEGAHILPNLPRVSASRREEALPYEPVCAIFRRYLHGRKLKFTPERAMILDAVLRRTGLFEAERLVADLKQIGHNVSRATTYRTLAHLQDAGILKQVFFDNKQSYYEVIAGRQTYDYLICVATGKVVEFSSDKLRKLRDEICREHGFSPLSHQFHIFALSPEAQSAPPAHAAPAPAHAGTAAPGVPLAQRDERGQREHGQANLAVPERRGGEVRHGGNHS
jgi:Fur family ferric uptake transcriptional regulator